MAYNTKYTSLQHCGRVMASGCLLIAVHAVTETRLECSTMQIPEQTQNRHNSVHTSLLMTASLLPHEKATSCPEMFWTFSCWISQAWQQQPPPFLQQQRPLRRLPTTPAEVAQAVQQKVVAMCKLSQHGKGDMQDIQNLMSAALLAVSFLALHCLVQHAAKQLQGTKCRCTAASLMHPSQCLRSLLHCRNVPCLPLTYC